MKKRDLGKHISRCIECGDLVVHSGTRGTPPLDVQDPTIPHRCLPIRKRHKRARSAPQEMVERSYMRIMGNIGLEAPQ